jgi:hypothetical protein
VQEQDPVNSSSRYTLIAQKKEKQHLSITIAFYDVYSLLLLE